MRCVQQRLMPLMIQNSGCSMYFVLFPCLFLMARIFFLNSAFFARFWRFFFFPVFANSKKPANKQWTNKCVRTGFGLWQHSHHFRKRLMVRFSTMVFMLLHVRVYFYLYTRNSCTNTVTILCIRNRQRCDLFASYEIYSAFRRALYPFPTQSFVYRERIVNGW